MKVSSPTILSFWMIPHLTKKILAEDINSLNLLVLSIVTLISSIVYAHSCQRFL